MDSSLISINITAVEGGHHYRQADTSTRLTWPRTHLTLYYDNHPLDLCVFVSAFPRRSDHGEVARTTEVEVVQCVWELLRRQSLVRKVARPVGAFAEHKYVFVFFSTQYVSFNYLSAFLLRSFCWAPWWSPTSLSAPQQSRLWASKAHRQGSLSLIHVTQKASINPRSKAPRVNLSRNGMHSNSLRALTLCGGNHSSLATNAHMGLSLKF